jgi:hypothetical protein
MVGLKYITENVIGDITIHVITLGLSANPTKISLSCNSCQKCINDGKLHLIIFKFVANLRAAFPIPKLMFVAFQLCMNQGILVLCYMKTSGTLLMFCF